MKAATIYRATAILFLAGIAGQQYLFARKPVVYSEYQRRIREAAQAAPSRVGSWVGQDVPVPVQALTMLKPNVMISRQYLDVATGEYAGLLLEHCSDAHDMAGHFPLRCYPARGWATRASRPREWTVGNLQLTGTEYQFVIDDEQTGVQKSVIVVNCLLRPGGLVLRDMNALARSIAGTGGETAGAGQLQIYFDARLPEARRDAAVVELVGGYATILDAILAKP